LELSHGFIHSSDIKISPQNNEKEQQGEAVQAMCELYSSYFYCNYQFHCYE
jgi:hypothetical protein